MAQNQNSQNLTGMKIVVAGDVMLNHYVFGDVSRISPEGPFPVLAITHETKDLGGAGGVFANLHALGATASLIGVVGEDAAADDIRNLCGASGKFIVAKDRPTIIKTRFVGNNAQMMRADREKVGALSAQDEDKIISLIAGELENAKALILSDYGKGALTPRVLQETIKSANARNIPVLVDPKGRDYSIYKGANVVTPNRKELVEATGGKAGNDAEVEATARKCLEESGIQSIVATRSEDGMTVLASKDARPVHLKADAREVFDVSGAGDTVIATLAAGLTLGLSLAEAASLANRAAGIVVGKRGVCVITKEELFGTETGHAWLECSEAKKLVDAWKSQGLKVGFTNGCFDIVHAGHVTYLAEAAKYCDRLVLALNHDNSVRILKGPTRPVNDENSRAIVMAGLSSVDCVVLFGAEKAGEDNTPGKVIGYLQPDIIFKGGDYTEDQLPEAAIARSYGGDVKIMGLVDGKSTTNIINKIATR